MYNALFEDEDDIFGGSPKSKLMDVVFNANNDIVRQELELFIEKYAVLELILESQGIEDVANEISNFAFVNQDSVEVKAKSLYIELMGSILSQSE